MQKNRIFLGKYLVILSSAGGTSKTEVYAYYIRQNTNSPKRGTDWISS
jgi:hypothetical protein